MPTRKLTAAFIEKVPLPSHGRIDYADAVLPGLHFRVSAKGLKSWNVYYRSPTARNPGTGVPIQRRPSLGRYPIVSLAVARQKARETLQSVAGGVDPLDEHQVEQIAPSTTCAAAAAEFLEKYEKPRNKKWRETSRILEHDVLPEWSNRELRTITRGDVLCILDGVVDRGSPVMANAVLVVTRKLFRWSTERGYVEASPVAGVRAPTRVRQRDRVLTDDQLVAVFLSCEELGYPFGPMVQLLIATAQRRGEVSTMLWTEIDLANASWGIPAEKAKSGRHHTVPLAPLALSIIEPLPRFNSSEYLFTTGGGTPVSGFSKVKQRLDRISGVTDWRFHDLRRTAASGMARLGTPVHVIGKVLSHRSSSAYGGITAVYNRYAYEEEKRAALESWCRYVDGLVAQRR